MHPIAQLHWYSEMGNKGCGAIDSVTEGKINLNDSTYNNTGDTYRDGIIDNFDNFKNPGYPLEDWKVYFSKLVSPHSKDIETSI
jgi:hypothetical protein